MRWSMPGKGCLLVDLFQGPGWMTAPCHLTAGGTHLVVARATAAGMHVVRAVRRSRLGFADVVRHLDV